MSTRGCEALGCSRATREGKPYCPRHLELNPYVGNVLAGIEAMVEEAEEVRRRGARAKNARGPLGRELLVKLRDAGGSATLDRLARNLNVEARVVRLLLWALQREGELTLSRGDRGQRVATLTLVD